MAAPILRIFTSSFRTKSRFYAPRLCRGVGGDVVAPPSEHAAGMQVTIMNQDQEGGIMVDSYSPLGFLLNNGIRVVGPCVLFPKSVVHWNVAEAADITEKSLEPFTMLEPKLDILVIGKGEREAKIGPHIIKYLREHKINVEILTTDQACATFNFLNSERRVCAAAMIPPSYVEQYEDDIVNMDLTQQLTAKVDYDEIGEKFPDSLPKGHGPAEFIEEGMKIAKIRIRKPDKPKGSPESLLDPIKKETGYDHIDEPKPSQQKKLESSEKDELRKLEPEEFKMDNDSDPERKK